MKRVLITLGVIAAMVILCSVITIFLATDLDLLMAAMGAMVLGFLALCAVVLVYASRA